MKRFSTLRTLIICSSMMFMMNFNSPVLAVQEVKKAPEDTYLFNKKDIKPNEVLSLQDCVSIAFYNSPEIKRYKYRLDVAKSNVGIAKSEYFPVIGAGVGFYNENNSNSSYFYSHSREFPSIAVTVNKLVWNFGKTTAYIKMEEFYKIGAEYEFMDSLCRTLFNVKEKYYNVLRAESQIEVAKKQISLCEGFYEYTQLLAKTDELYDDDVTSARLHLSNAKIKYFDAVTDYKNALLDLKNAMFIDKEVTYTIKQTKSFDYKNEYIKSQPVKHFVAATLPFNDDNIIDIAYKNSPDLRVLESTQKAMESSLLYVKRTYLPDINVSAGYGFNNAKYQNSNNSFRVGVSIDSNVNIMQLRHSIKGADAMVKDAENEITYYKKNLYIKVRKAMNDLRKLENQIPLSQQRTENSYVHLKTTSYRYKSKAQDYTALQDAMDWYTEAMTDYINMLYEYNMALIAVEEATHSHILDIHHKSKHAVHHHEGELIEFVSNWMNCDEKEVKKTKIRG